MDTIINPIREKVSLNVLEASDFFLSFEGDSKSESIFFIST
jgi:hypothetical protein